MVNFLGVRDVDKPSYKQNILVVSIVLLVLYFIISVLINSKSLMLSNLINTFLQLAIISIIIFGLLILILENPFTLCTVYRRVSDSISVIKKIESSDKLDCYMVRRLISNIRDIQYFTTPTDSLYLITGSEGSKKEEISIRRVSFYLSERLELLISWIDTANLSQFKKEGLSKKLKRIVEGIYSLDKREIINAANELPSYPKTKTKSLKEVLEEKNARPTIGMIIKKIVEYCDRHRGGVLVLLAVVVVIYCMVTGKLQINIEKLISLP